MAKYGKKAQSKVKRAMHKRKRGTLKSGSGKKVKSKEQAIAIGLSEARKAGGKAPKKASRKKSTSKKKSSSRKKSSSSRKSSARKSSSRKKPASRKKSSGRSHKRKSTKKRSKS
ncbi:MAG TPA: DUF6496 domain-containing protein [Burkholderiales bacterium]|nr:DUF6496 domain-containing protein [Burkholderiales bacterium]